MESPQFDVLSMMFLVDLFGTANDTLFGIIFRVYVRYGSGSISGKSGWSRLKVEPLMAMKTGTLKVI